MGQAQSGPIGPIGPIGPRGPAVDVDYSELEKKITVNPEFQSIVSNYPALTNSVTTALGNSSALVQSVSSALTKGLGGDMAFQANLVSLLQGSASFRSAVGNSLVSAIMADPVFNSGLISTLATNPRFTGVTNFGDLNPDQLATLISKLSSDYSNSIVTGLATSPTLQAAITASISNPTSAQLFRGPLGPAGETGPAGPIGPTGSQANVLAGVKVNNSGPINEQGAYLQWNKEDGLGKTYLMNSQGSGKGGFVFGKSTGGDNVSKLVEIDNDGNIGLNRGQSIKFAGLADNGHGIGHANAFPGKLPKDGPFMWGWNGGQAGSMSGGPKAAIHWDDQGDSGNTSINGDLYVVGQSHHSGGLQVGDWAIGQDKDGKLTFVNSKTKAFVNLDTAGAVETPRVRFRPGDYSIGGVPDGSQLSTYTGEDPTKYGMAWRADNKNLYLAGESNTNGNINVGGTVIAKGDVNANGRISAGNDVIARNGIWFGNGAGNPGAWHLFPSDSNDQNTELQLSSTKDAGGNGRQEFAFNRERGNIWTRSRNNFI